MNADPSTLFVTAVRSLAEDYDGVTGVRSLAEDYDGVTGVRSLAEEYDGVTGVRSLAEEYDGVTAFRMWHDLLHKRKRWKRFRNEDIDCP